MAVPENIQLHEEYIAALNAHSVERQLALLADDVVWSDVSLPEPLTSKAALRQHLQGRVAAFPDLKVTVKNHVVSDDQIAAEVEFSGTHRGPLPLASGAALPATGKSVTVKGTYFVRVRGGKAVEVHAYPDRAALMMQLGIISPPGQLKS